MGDIWNGHTIHKGSISLVVELEIAESGQHDAPTRQRKPMRLREEAIGRSSLALEREALGRIGALETAVEKGRPVANATISTPALRQVAINAESSILLCRFVTMNGERDGEAGVSILRQRRPMESLKWKLPWRSTRSGQTAEHRRYTQGRQMELLTESSKLKLSEH